MTSNRTIKYGETLTQQSNVNLHPTENQQIATGFVQV